MNRRFLDDLSLAMADVYAACTDRLLINLARHFQLIKDGKVPGSWEYQIRKLAEMGQVTRESEAIILETLGDADQALQGVLEEAIRNGLKDADPALKKAAEKGLLHGQGFFPEVAPNQMQAFQMYYKQSADKLNLVNTVMLESTQAAYQATVSDIVSRIETTQTILNTSTGEVITGVESFNKVLHDSVRKMVANNLTGFIDHGNHHWSPEAYVAMDMRTTMANTARAAVNERMDEYGCDLYQVSSHNGARPLCYPWQGKVISRSGWTGEVEDLDGNKVTVHSEDEIESFREGGGLFGVNCGHHMIPFVPGFSRSRPPQQNEEANAREYAESQEQRRLERELRGEKRELEVMKAQGATDEEIRTQKQRVTKARDDLENFCDDTGRPRRREREYTPINATWPDEKSLKSVRIDDSINTGIENAYHSKGDPLRDAMGSIKDSHPQEMEQMISKAKALGVEIIPDERGIAYAPGFFPGDVGQLHISPEDSYGAWKHEMRHLTDDEKDGFPGFRALANIERRIRMETDAYQEEIDIAFGIGRSDIAEMLKKNLNDEINDILFGKEEIK